MIRSFPLTSFTPPALKVHSQHDDVMLHAHRRRQHHSHIVAQRALDGRRDGAAADLGVLPRSNVDGALHLVHVLRAGVHGDVRLEQREEALQDHALEELDVTALVLGKRVDGLAGGREEVLEVLLALLEQLQTGLVRQSRLRAAD